MHSVPLPPIFPIVAARIRDILIESTCGWDRTPSNWLMRGVTAEQRAEPRDTEYDSVKVLNTL